MKRILELWRSTVGRKQIAAVTGVALLGWLVLHLLGNLSAFSGAAAMDGYARALHRAPALLWLMRALLFGAFAVHVLAVVTLARRARAARPVGYARQRLRASSVAARSMRWGGALLLAFVVFHVLHMTVGALHPSFVPGRVHENLVQGLSRSGMAAIYTAAAGLVALHLHHGLFAAPRSLGLWPRQFRQTAGRPRSRGAALFALAMFVGFAAVPVAVALGVVR